jgi:hypothetical protein
VPPRACPVEAPRGTRPLRRGVRCRSSATGQRRRPAARGLVDSMTGRQAPAASGRRDQMLRTTNVRPLRPLGTCPSEVPPSRVAQQPAAPPIAMSRLVFRCAAAAAAPPPTLARSGLHGLPERRSEIDTRDNQKTCLSRRETSGSQSRHGSCCRAPGYLATFIGV